MDKEAIIKLISEPDELNKVSIEQLEELVNKYPYFNQLHGLLHSKKQLIKTNPSLQPSIKDSGVEKKASSQFYEEEEHYKEEGDFEELEEENINLPFHDDSLKFNKEDHAEKKISTSTIEQPQEVVEEDVAYLLKKAGLSNAKKADDLTLVSFIDFETQALLNKSGLYTYSQLKKLDENRDTELLSKLTGKLKHQILSWKDDCTVLFYNKYHRLLIEKIGLAFYNDRNDLQKISGIGTILEAKLNKAGVLTYRQLACLEKKDIDILTELIDYFPGRIGRDEWVSQAKLKLAQQKAPNQKTAENNIEEDEISRLKAKVEAHKNLKLGIGVVSNSALNPNSQNNEHVTESPRESFRDWLAKMNRTSDTVDEKKNLLVSDSTNQPPI